MITLLPDSATLDDIASVVAAGDVPLIGDSRWPRAQWDALRALGGEVPEHAAWATLTSGSSGTSRVVLRTAASWRDSFAAVSRLLGEGAVFLPAPPSASMTLFSLAHALDGGPRPVLGAADDTVTAFHGTPHALRALLDAGAPRQFRAALVGGSHVDPQLRADAEAAGIRVTAYYGAAELSFVASDEGEGLRAFPGVELAVRDGELWVNSPYVALGYLGSAGPLRRDGAWATVGDRAELTNDTIRLLGRADDAILSASATIVPEEVEAALRTIPGITDAVVFALPRPRVGSLVAALIEHDGTVTDLKQACAERLTITHRPRAWYSGTIPRTASGKPARAEVARRALAGEIDRYVF